MEVALKYKISTREYSLEDLENELPFDVLSLMYRFSLKGWEIFKCIQDSQDTYGGKIEPVGYKTLELKMKGKTRTVHSPNEYIKSVQDRMSDIWRDIAVPSYNIAYEPGTSIFSSLHGSGIRGSEVIILTDVKNYFPSISRSMVSRTLRSVGYSEFISDIVSGVYTLKYKGRRFLPQGAPFSPLISNRVATLMLDPWVLSVLEESHSSWKYLRYCDNLIVYLPHGEPLLDRPEEVLENIRSNVHMGTEFRLHKDGIKRPKDKQKVLGLVCNDGINVPRRYYDALKAILHNIRANGWEVELERWNQSKGTSISLEQFRAVLKGMCDYVIKNTTSGSRVSKILRYKEALVWT